MTALKLKRTVKGSHYMKTIFLLFDSLNLRYLQPYGNSEVYCPNFQRVAQHAVTFDQCYAASLPCMPARRDLHTGRINFLHRSWGPMEPYDRSFISCLRDAGIYTHLISDHMHYWEEGGSNYHTKYDSWEIIRGQEGDGWIPSIEPCDLSNLLGRNDVFRRHDIANRKVMEESGKYPLDEITSNTMRFLANNHDKDNWFLHVESFDPHEPFFSHEEFQQLYEDDYIGQEFDWPDYKKVSETKQQIEHCRKRYASLVSACDAFLGKLLDAFDEYSMWDDTQLIVTTDHGYLLGEHGWWAKTVQPVYNEVAHTPLFWWSPLWKQAGTRSDQLCQICDFAPTILRDYGIHIPEHMTGTPLKFDMTAQKQREKDCCLFGLFGCYLNITDGDYVYMRRPRSTALFEYTLMPNHMKAAFPQEQMKGAQLVSGFSFTDGYPVLRIPAEPWANIDFDEYGDMLFDITKDPQQLNPIDLPSVKTRLCELMSQELKRCEAPEEAYAYWDLKKV